MSLTDAPVTTCHADHRPYGHREAMPVRTVRDVLDSHGVASREATDGSVLAWEEATIRTVHGVTDASAWVAVPTDACGLAAWLGY